MVKSEVRTWIDIDSSAVKSNVKTMRSLLAKGTKLWAVVKSNAYGHGIFAMPPILEKAGVDGFCVDSIIEGLRLREFGIKKPVLVLGLTMPANLESAKKSGVTVTISNFESLMKIAAIKNPPDFHLKIDTGMHRQGFYPEEVPELISKIKKSGALGSALKGVYTHFASAKDLNYPTYTEMQFGQFMGVVFKLRAAGWTKLIRHAAATGGALLNKKYHLDAVRAGIGLYGLWPSKELELQLQEINFNPALSWKTVVGEVKKIKKGDYVGYDLVERANRDMTAAVLPVGYWHGFPRALSGRGEVLINGIRARVLGRVSMDMIAVDATGANCRFGDIVTLIGRNGDDEITAGEIARLCDTSHYETVTRLNPLMERVVI